MLHRGEWAVLYLGHHTGRGKAILSSSKVEFRQVVWPLHLQADGTPFRYNLIKMIKCFYKPIQNLATPERALRIKKK